MAPMGCAQCRLTRLLVCCSSSSSSSSNSLILHQSPPHLLVHHAACCISMQVNVSADRLFVEGTRVSAAAAAPQHHPDVTLLTPLCLTPPPCVPPVPPMQVNTSADRLFVEGTRVSAAAASTSCYFAVHKPAGYICSNVSKEPGTRAVDLLQPWLDKWQDRHRVRAYAL
jgi:hypothetical protein